VRIPLFAIIALSIPALQGQSHPQMPAEATARLRRLSLEHDEALRKGNLVRAAELAVLIRDGTQKALNASEIDDTLAWLPPDTESLLVWDERQRLRSTDTQASLVNREPEYFARTKLLALDNGGVYRKLAGRTIRLVVIGIGKIEAIAYGDDSKFKLDSDFSGFYFFEDPVAEVNFGSVDTPIDHVAVWRASVGQESNWIALVRGIFGNRSSFRRSQPGSRSGRSMMVGRFPRNHRMKIEN
jgi:hypothetical protein